MKVQNSIISHCDPSNLMTNKLFQKEQSLYYKHSSERWQKQRLCRTVAGYSICWWTSQENKQMTLGWWKVRKWQTQSDSRCSAANNKLHCLTMTKKKKTTEGRRMPKWGPAHATAIKNGKHCLRYPIFHFDFSGGQMRNSLQHAGRCPSSPCPLTLFTQLDVEIVLLLHLKSLASAFDMIYWAGKPLSSCINLGFSASPSAAPQQPPCYLCCSGGLINIS